MQDFHSELQIELTRQAEKTARAVAEKLKRLQIKLALAESCTAGFISGLLANTDGVSSVLWGSFVCYTKEAKTQMLDLDGNELDKYGLVSRQTACKMAEGALKKSGADFAAAVTGLAGPQGDDSGVPVGTIWTAIAVKNRGTNEKMFHFSGSRNEIRVMAAIAVLESLHEYLIKIS